MTARRLVERVAMRGVDLSRRVGDLVAFAVFVPFLLLVVVHVWIADLIAPADARGKE